MADYWRFYKDNEFKAKVEHEMITAAIAVMAEEDVTAGHALRVTYAGKILDGTASVEQMAKGVITNATVKGRITDDLDYTDILAFTVNSLYNAFAGVS